MRGEGGQGGKGREGGEGKGSGGGKEGHRPRHLLEGSSHLLRPNMVTRL